MSIQFQFSTNPQTVNSPKEDKIAELKKQQEERRSELLGFVDEYRAKYADSQKKYAQAQSVFLLQQRELKRHNETDRDYAKYEKEFNIAKKEYQGARSDKDLKLDLLQFRTDDYTKACRTNLIDLA